MERSASEIAEELEAVSDTSEGTQADAPEEPVEEDSIWGANAEEEEEKLFSARRASLLSERSTSFSAQGQLELNTNNGKKDLDDEVEVVEEDEEEEEEE